MLWFKRSFLMGTVALAGCGFEPVYTDEVSAALNNQIAVDDIDGLIGFETRRALEDRLGVTTAPRYRLAVTISVDSEGLAITDDNETTRYNLTGTAKFDLTPAGASVPAFSDRVIALTAYSAIAAPYATRIAERDANARLARALADHVVNRLSITAKSWAK